MPSPQNIAPSPRSTLKRGKERAVYDPSDIRSILAAGVVAHVGVTTDDGPIVLPMAYGVRGDEILIHGSIANAMMRGGRSVDVCVTVTIIDALVIARTPFHNSMNYRSVVIRGTATAIAGSDEKTAALKVINDHIAPIWDTARPPNEQDLKLTMVLSVPLDEASAKVRGGDPIDDPEDMQTDYWAGRLPLQSTWGQPIPAADLKGDIPIPSVVAAMAETEAYQYSSK